MKSIIKYPGGKLWLVPRLERLINEVSPECVAEPFCGGLSLSLNYEFQKVIANDVINPLINLYRHAQCGGIPNRDDWKFSYDDYMNIRSEFRQLCLAGKCNTQYTADMFWYLSATVLTDLFGLISLDYGMFHQVNTKKSLPLKIFQNSHE